MRPESLAFPWSSLQEGQGLYRLGVSLKLKRWIEELADHLPSADEIIRRLNEQQPITEAHFDEIFPCGMDPCVLVLEGEYERLLATQVMTRG